MYVIIYFYFLKKIKSIDFFTGSIGFAGRTGNQLIQLELTSF